MFWLGLWLGLNLLAKFFSPRMCSCCPSFFLSVLMCPCLLAVLPAGAGFSFFFFFFFFFFLFVRWCSWLGYCCCCFNCWCYCRFCCWYFSWCFYCSDCCFCCCGCCCWFCMGISLPFLDYLGPPLFFIGVVPSFLVCALVGLVGCYCCCCGYCCFGGLLRGRIWWNGPAVCKPSIGATIMTWSLYCIVWGMAWKTPLSGHMVKK